MFNTFIPPKSKPLRMYPLPAPGAPANIIALGASDISFNKIPSDMYFL